MTDIRTGCNYHTQDLVNSCGAAAAMMILDHLGQPAGSFNQPTALAVLTNGVIGKGTRPSNLRTFLNSRLGANTFTVNQPANAKALTGVISQAFQQMPTMPLAVPIYATSHWVVVEGIRFGPTGAVLGFFIHCPMHWGLGHPPPHTADDCGQGGSHGVAGVFFSLPDWLQDVQLPSGLFRLACVVATAASAGPPSDTASPPLLTTGFDSTKVRNELIAYGFEGELGSLDGLKIGNSILVHRLDIPEADYRLVPLSDSRGIVALTSFDDKEGWLRSVSIPTEPLASFRPTDSGIVGALLDLGPLGDFLPSAGWWQDRLEGARNVWQPCVESFSPFLPFIEVPLVDVASQSVVYVRFDLSVSYALTEPVQGG